MTDWVEYAQLEIARRFEDDVIIKYKTLLKFGQNQTVGTTPTTVMELTGSETEETYVSDNLINRLVSDSAANDENVTVNVEGHTIDGNGDFTFVVQSVSLNGQTAVVLPTPLARISRLENTSNQALAASSKVYGFQSTSAVSAGGVPEDDAKIHIQMSGADGATLRRDQSLKAATTFSSVDYCAITGVFASINKKTSASADVAFQVRNQNGVFRTQLISGLGTTGSNQLFIPIKPHFIVPKNSDIAIVTVASTGNVSIAANWTSYLLTLRR